MSNDEKDALMTALTQQREHILAIADAMSEDQLRQPALPSGWTPLGLIRHLAVEVERFWFRCAVAGEPFTPSQGNENWLVPPDLPAAAVISLYRDEITRANAIIAATPVDAMPKWWPDFFADLPARPLRKTLLHVITETATHAGHLDAARELADGGQWLVLTE